MPRLVVVRPGETDFHWQGRLRGRSDVDLNEFGRNQANQLVRHLSQWEFASVAVAPLKRAIATAMPYCETEDVVLHPVAAFQAADLGDWEGKRVESLMHTDSSRYQNWLTDPDFRAPGGESMREIYRRSYSDIADMVYSADATQTLGFVLPISVLRVFCCAALDLPLSAACRFAINPAGIAVFERMAPGAPYQLVSWNQPSDLEREFLNNIYEEELPNV